MREAIGGTWLFGLVITFIVFFASFLAVSINYSKAFNVKNNVVDLISKYEGNNINARSHIASYLRTTGYLVTGTCPKKGDNIGGVESNYNYVGYNLEGEKVNAGEKAYFCISCDSTDSNETINKRFYRVIVFFKIDLPVVGNITTFRIKGETESIYYPSDDPKNFCDKP